MVGLSALTRQQLEALFASGDAAEVERLLVSECAENLLLVGDATPSGLERLRAAALRLSDGSLVRLRQAIDLAKLDWRDLLVASDLADDIHAHRRWQPRRLRSETVERWKAGDLRDDVDFGLDARVEVRFGLDRGTTGRVLELVGLEPEARYLLELDSGERVERSQRSLQSTGPLIIAKRPEDALRWRVYDDDGVLIAEADLDPAHPLHQAPDGSVSGPAIGRFTPGPGFARLSPLLDEMNRTFNAGEIEGALAISDKMDALGLWATDPNGGLFGLSNLQFQQGGLLFFAGPRSR
jgi:hypothetical protein